MLEGLDGILDKFIHLEEQLGDPSVTSDQSRFRKVNKEYKSLLPIVEAINAYKAAHEGIAEAKEMMKTDPDMKEMAREELNLLVPEAERWEEKLKELLTPKDPDDTKDVIMEIRSGTGGDEAAIFAGDLYRMYLRYFSTQDDWEVEIIDENEGTVGGYSKIVLEVSGTDVYGKLKFESGAHRVQRIPATESKGRVHTSAASVVVMPKFEMEDIDIKKDDIRTDVFRASGAGGQHVNKTESGVRFTHIPTGTVSESTESRSQIKNREIAFNRLAIKIREKLQDAHDSKVASERRSLVGSGDRSEKIRTYNWPQNRVTDHRLEGNVKNYNLDKVVEGDIEGIIEALTIAEQAEKLKAEQQ